MSLPTGTIDPVLVDVAVKLAGYWYSTAHGVTSYDEQGNPITRLYGDFKDALGTLEMIVKGDLVLE
jgi:hypothetical protein